MNCPRCASPLEDVTPDPRMQDVHGQGCARCGGAWLTQRGLHTLEQVVTVKWIELRHLPPEEVQQALLSCPACGPGQTLDKVKSERDRKVVLDACSRCHGVWLDRGELEAIQEKGVAAALVDVVRFFTAKG